MPTAGDDVMRVEVSVQTLQDCWETLYFGYFRVLLPFQSFQCHSKLPTACPGPCPHFSSPTSLRSIAGDTLPTSARSERRSARGSWAHGAEGDGLGASLHPSDTVQ